MKISVVIPTYNEEEYIAACLKSVCSQTVPVDEIIVVDNNNQDKTSQIARKMGANVIKEPNQGMISARNKGFDSANFELIARLDADVVVPPNWTKAIKDYFTDPFISALSFPIFYYDGLIKSTLPEKVYTRVLRVALMANDVLLGPNMVLTKDIWQKVRPYVNLNDSDVHDDVDLSINIVRQGGKIIRGKDLIVGTSARRIKNRPSSFFIEYPLRLINTFRVNQFS